MTVAYLKLAGEKVKYIQGSVRDRDDDKNGSIALVAVVHSLVSPRDAATGLASGKRQHHPITVTKETDATTPIFYGLLARNEEITKAEFFFFGAADQGGFLAGREELLYKITLKKAFVSRMDFVGYADEEAKGGGRLPLRDRISFVYDSIQWEWMNPSRVEEDIFSSRL